MAEMLTYNFKKYVRNKEGLLFGILFPLAFAMIYSLALGDTVKGEIDMDPIPVAIVQETQDSNVTQFVEQMGTPGQVKDKHLVVKKGESETGLLNYVITDKQTAKKYLNQKAVNYIVTINHANSKVSINVLLDGAKSVDIQTKVLYQYLKSFTGIYNVTVQTLQSNEIDMLAMTKVPKILEQMDQDKVIKRQGNVNGSSNFFYACMGYLCIFFMSVGIQIALLNEANHSVTGLRELMSPVSKLKRSMITFAALFLISLVVAYVAYLLFLVNGIPIGDSYSEMGLLIFLGVLLGILLGWFVGTYIRGKESIINGVAIAIPLILGVLAGMMAKPVKQMIVKDAPWLNKLNPLSLISDAIYYLNHYPSKTEFYQNIGLLAVWCVALAVLIIIGARRENYESL